MSILLVDLLVSQSAFIDCVFNLLHEIAGQFFQEETRIDKDTNMLALHGFEPISLVKNTISHSSWNYNSCFFILNSMNDDLESRHILSGLQLDDRS